MTEQHSAFRDEVVLGFARALGLTYEQLSADFDAVTAAEAEAVAKAREWWKAFWLYEERRLAAYRRHMNSLLFSIYIAEEASVWVGYDPQRLLTYEGNCAPPPPVS